MTRDEIVAAARSWEGTPYHHQARGPKGVGVDCIGLVIAVAAEVGLIIPAPSNYTRTANSGLLLRAIADAKVSTKIENGDALPGDIVLMAFRVQPQHFGILTRPLSEDGGWIMHALDGHAVVETPFGEWGEPKRWWGTFRLHGITA